MQWAPMHRELGGDQQEVVKRWDKINEAPKIFAKDVGLPSIGDYSPTPTEE